MRIRRRVVTEERLTLTRTGDRGRDIARGIVGFVGQENDRDRG